MTKRVITEEYEKRSPTRGKVTIRNGKQAGRKQSSRLRKIKRRRRRQGETFLKQNRKEKKKD